MSDYEKYIIKKMIRTSETTIYSVNDVLNITEKLCDFMIAGQFDIDYALSMLRKIQETRVSND